MFTARYGLDLLIEFRLIFILNVFDLLGDTSDACIDTHSKQFVSTSMTETNDKYAAKVPK